MPIGNGGGIRGRGGILAMPGKRFGAAQPNFADTLTSVSRPFRSPPFSTYNNTRITGVTKDSTGASLGSCVVQLFRTSNDQLIEESTSDGSGNYSFAPTDYGPFYVVAYKAGAPDVAGTTVNTLVGV